MYRYRGKVWSEGDIERIRALIAGSSGACRSELARRVCQAFDWRRPDGRLKEMCCRDAMLRMYRQGLIELPAPSSRHRRPRQIFASEASDPQPPLELEIKDLVDLRLELVARGKPLALWNELIGRYHYLGYRVMPGAQLRYFVIAGGRVLGAMGFGGALQQHFAAILEL